MFRKWPVPVRELPVFFRIVRQVLPVLSELLESVPGAEFVRPVPRLSNRAFIRCWMRRALSTIHHHISERNIKYANHLQSISVEKKIDIFL